MVRVPRPEGIQVFWRPVVLGHEIAHLAVQETNAVATLDIDTRFDIQKAKEVSSGLQPLKLLELAKKWTAEAICDAYAVSRFGPPAVAALGEFLSVVGATYHVSDTHPPGWLRLRLMLGVLSDRTTGYIADLLGPWEAESKAPTGLDPSMTFLADFMIDLGPEIKSLVENWGAPVHDAVSRLSEAEEGYMMLEAGVPPLSHDLGRVAMDPLADADVVAAAWVARTRESQSPVDVLGDKSLDDIEFLRRWAEAGGTFGDPPTIDLGLGPETAVLSKAHLVARLATDVQATRLIVQPLLPGAVSGAGIDLRLGNRFVVFVRSRAPSFDPLSETDDPRILQRHAELDWGEDFVLHPGELVLAATLEYLVLPADLTAQVITRSSYGRLGLLSATAVQVHPWFRGCLTLELVNLGTLPIVLTPGERIAQLVVYTTSPVPQADVGKYQRDVGPQFSRVKTDEEAVVLRALRATGRA
jgi:deoxycytidine triphosphate deaminase